MGLCKTSNFSIFTFINASDLKFCTHSYSSCVYHMIRFKGSNGKVCKMMMSHFRTLFGLMYSRCFFLGGKGGWRKKERRRTSNCVHACELNSYPKENPFYSTGLLGFEY